MRQFIEKVDNWLTYKGLLSKTGALLLSLGVLLTFISFWLGIHVLMFVPAFVISLFLYSFFDVYFFNKNIKVLWQIIRKRITLRILFDKEKDYSFFKLLENVNGKYRYIAPNSNLECLGDSNAVRYYLVVQGRLDVFKSIIEISSPPIISDKEENILSIAQSDQYFNVRPYQVGDSLSRVDVMQTMKRGFVYIRESISDIIRVKKKKAKENINILLESNLSLKLREDISKGPIVEWILILIAILAVWLEWGGFVFVSISAVLILLVYLMNKVYKIPRYGRKIMNVWMILLFSGFIFETYITWDMVLAGVHFLILFCVLKHRFERERRDAFTFIFLVLFVFVAISFFNLKIWFMILFLVYLFVAVALFSIYSGGEREEEYKLNFGRPKTKKSYLNMNFWIIVTTLLLFFVLPHGQKIQTGSAFNAFRKDVQKTGFSDEVGLDNIQNIKRDFSKSFLIENVTKDEVNKYESLYWRGMRLGIFRNSSWTNPNTYKLPYLVSKKIPTSTHTKTLQIKYFPNDSNAIFLPTVPISLEDFNFLQIGMDSNIIRFKNKLLKAAVVYAKFLTNERGEIIDIPTPNLQYMLAMDEDTITLMNKFWDKIPKNIQNDPNKITYYIQNDAGFSYSLENTASNLASFLYEEKKGHCEYFATVLALTLQHFGYEAVMVNGFHGGEFNELNNTWVVRGKDAHSWVEIKDELGRWTILDATPISLESSFWFKDFSIIENVITYYDLVDYVWYKYIVHFEVSRQYQFWKYLLDRYVYILSTASVIVLGWITSFFYKKYWIVYLKLSNKQKFMYWLSKKVNIEHFPLKALYSKYPALVIKTRKIIYDDKYDDSYLGEIKKSWEDML